MKRGLSERRWEGRAVDRDVEVDEVLVCSKVSCPLDSLVSGLAHWLSRARGQYDVMCCVNVRLCGLRVRRRAGAAVRSAWVAVRKVWNV